MASTMTLDCLVNGIRVINIGASLDGFDLSPIYRSEHYAHLVELNLVEIVYSYDDLVTELKRSDKEVANVDIEKLSKLIQPRSEKLVTEFNQKISTLIAQQG
jgi:hypothetical protein